MSLISTTKISKSFGDRDLFTNLSVSIPAKARIGLVGQNGIGKTTLLEIFGKIQTPSAGKVNHAREIKLGYLPQVADFISDETLWDSCVKILSQIHEIASDLSSLEKMMEKSGLDKETLQRYAQRQEEFERLGGYTYEVRVSQVLTGLGFAKSDYKMPISKLSGGQRTRAMFARIILSDPDVMLLDEPTNYLDVGSIEWLENYLKDWQGAAVIVSHDRYFLDQVVNVIWELTPDLEVFHGNYTTYTQQREERYVRRLAEYQRQQRFIEKEQDFIRRNIAGQNTKQAQGRRTRLERMLRDSRLYMPIQNSDISLKIKAAHRSGDQIIKTRCLKVGYKDEGEPLFSSPDIILNRGECVALIGPNGAGKSTFIKTILGQIAPYGGDVITGSSLVIGYFEQAHQSLSPENTVIQEIEKVAPDMLPAEIRRYLAGFQFTEDDVFSHVAVLSGGERARLALTILSLQDANLLLLDEPTSHLDISSQEILQTILKKYEGTIVLVSHDRYLISELATQIWEISPSQSRLEVFNGSYAEYRTWTMNKQKAENSTNIKEKGVKSPDDAQPGKARKKQRDKKIKALEEKIGSLENKIEEITHDLEIADEDFENIKKLGNNYNAYKKELDDLYAEWDKITTAE